MANTNNSEAKRIGKELKTCARCVADGLITNSAGLNDYLQALRIMLARAESFAAQSTHSTVEHSHVMTAAERVSSAVKFHSAVK